MWIVHRDEVGRTVFDRMVRDRVIVPLLPGIAVPADIDPGPPIRRRALADCLPRGAQATGAAALWAHGLGALPHVVDVRTAPGRHVRNWSGPLPLRFHATGLSAPGGAIADVGPATADARRWPVSVRGAQYGRRLAPVSRRAS